MKYDELNASLSGRNKLRRKLANNTYAERREGGAIAIRLHQTDILTYSENGTVAVNTGGWKTVTTKARLNEYLPTRLYQDKGLWYWSGGALFTDGDTLDAEGKVHTQAKNGQEKSSLALRKRILKYAALCAAAVPLAMPGPGDCFCCGMTTEGTSHLDSHLDEGYVVPSLVWRAMLEKGWTTDKIPFAAAFGQTDFMLDVAQREVKRAVAKFMYKRYGLPA